MMSNKNMHKTMINKNRVSKFRPVIIAMALAAILLMPFAVSAEEVFAELSGMDNVESTYVSGRFAHNKKTWYSASRQHGMDLSRGFSALYTYQCYSEESVAKAKKILKDYLKKNRDIEVVMKTSQGMQEYVVYEKFSDDGKLIKQMIIWNSDAPNVCEIVVVDWNKGLEPTQSPYSWSTQGGRVIDMNGFTSNAAELEDAFGMSLDESLEKVFSSVDWDVIRNYDWKGAFDKAFEQFGQQKQD